MTNMGFKPVFCYSQPVFKLFFSDYVTDKQAGNVLTVMREYLPNVIPWSLKIGLSFLGGGFV